MAHDSLYRQLPDLVVIEFVLMSFFYLVTLFKDYIEAGQKDGSIRSVSAEKMAFILMGMLNGLGRQKLLLSLEIPDPDLCQEVLDFCYHSLSKKC